MLSFIHIPGSIGIDANTSLGAQDSADFPNAGHIFTQQLTRFAHFHLGCATAIKVRENLSNLIWGNSRNGCIDHDLVSIQLRQWLPTKLKSGSKPVHSFVIVVFHKGAELGPTFWALEQHHFSRPNATELHS